MTMSCICQSNSILHEWFGGVTCLTHMWTQPIHEGFLSQLILKNQCIPHSTKVDGH